MKQRVKRYHPKSESKIRINLTITGLEIIGDLIDISLAGASFVCHDLDKNIEDELGQATILAGSHKINIGKVIVSRQRGRDSFDFSNFAEDSDKLKGQQIVALKTLSDYIPIEKILPYLESDGKSPYEFELAHGKFTLADFNSYPGSDDLLEKTRVIKKLQDAWKKKGSYQYERYRLPSKGERVLLDLPRGNKRLDYLTFGSNDYLGFASHPEVIQAAVDALYAYGVGSTGSGVSTGLSLEHRKLNELLAKIFQKEASILFNSGYTANVGIIGSLCREKDLVLYDKIAHASIQDAIVFAASNGATCIPFKHNDAAHLESLLAEHRSSHNGCLVVTEGIFSMDGTIAELSEIVPVAKKYNSRIFLDSAHDFGVIGDNGFGAAEYHNVLSEIDILMGTFSKIAGGIGGFAVGNIETIEYLRMMARTHIFTVSIPPSMAASAHKALSLFIEDKSYLRKLKENIRFFVKGLRDIGVTIPANHQSSICPVMVGEEEKLEVMTNILYENGIHATPVVYPVVSRNRCRFRFTVTANHKQGDLDYVLLVIKTAMEKVGGLTLKKE